MARRRKFYTGDEDTLAGLFPGLMRGPGGVPIPPKTPTGGGSGGGGGTTGGTAGGGGAGGPGQPAAPKPGSAAAKKAAAAAAKKAAAAVSGSSTGSSSYDKYLAQQRADANKASRKSANKAINSAEALKGQAQALRVLLGLPAGGGANPFKVGGMRTAGPKSKFGESWTSNWEHKNASGMFNTQNPNAPGNNNPNLPGNQNGNNGVRTGTDVKPGPGMPGFKPPPKPGGGQGGGGQGGGAGQGPRHGTQPPRNAPTTARTVTGAGANRWAGIEGHTGPGNPPRQGGQQGGKKKGGGQQPTGGWGSDDWKKNYPGGGPGGGGGGGGNGNGGDGHGDGRGKRGDRNLRDRGLSGELKQKLKNVEEAMKDADATMMKSYDETVGNLERSTKDNEKSANAQGFMAVGERGRQRANAMSELMAQGAGESDTLRGQGMSLRNWNANQNEVNRAFHDTLSSINTSLGEATADTRTARVGNFQQAQSDKNALWDNYFDAKADAWTNLGNVYGQQAQYYGDANEQVGSKKSRKRGKRAQHKSDHAFMMAARAGSQSRDQTEVPDRLMDWKGHDDFEGAINNNTINSMAAGPAMTRPEGATLRKWNA